MSMVFCFECVCYIQMKLQRFIENYRQNRCQRTQSPDRSGVFRTSESIGTLNSRDEFATDRSFAIKEIPIYHNSHKKESTQEVEMLRDLCASERPPTGSKPFQKSHNKVIEQFTCQQPPQSLPQVEAFTTTFSKSNKSQLIRPTFSFRHENLQNNDELYEQAPSMQYYESKSEDKMALLLSHEEQLFLGQLQVLMEKVEKLQAQNLELEQKWLEQERLSIKYQRACDVLEDQVTTLKERVTTTIQQNIEIENMIKEVLLKQEMQKYHCFTKEESRKVIRREEQSLRSKIPL